MSWTDARNIQPVILSRRSRGEGGRAERRSAAKNLLMPCSSHLEILRRASALPTTDAPAPSPAQDDGDRVRGRA
jgi:hypothetical protein